KLAEIQRAVEYVTAHEAESAFKVERREDLPGDDGCAEVRRIFRHRVDHHLGHLFTMIVPGRAIRQLGRGVLAEQARDMGPARRERLVQGGGNEKLDDGALRPAMRARV